MSDPRDEARPGKGDGQAPEEPAAEAGPGEGREDRAAETPQETGVTLVGEPPPTREAYEALRSENAELREQLLRRRAEFENYRKRMERERGSAGQDAVAGLLKDLVATLDNLERALDSPGEGAAVRDGVVLIQRALLATLEAHGLRVDDPLGRPFDPQLHQALSYDDAPGYQDGTVLQVRGKGYFHKDRLLRPALVQVARGAEAPARGDQAPADADPAGGGGDAQAPEDAPGDTTRTDELH